MLPILTDMITNQNSKLTKKARYYANPGPLESLTKRFMAEKAVFSSTSIISRLFSIRNDDLHLDILH